MRATRPTLIAASLTTAALLLTGCSTSDTTDTPAPSSAGTSTTATASSEPVNSAAPTLPAAIENPENRPITVVPADQTTVTVPVGTMLYFDVTTDQGWTATMSGDAIELEDVFLEGTMDDNPYWGMYRAIAPGPATVTIMLLDNEGNSTTTHEYAITVE